MAEWKVLAPRR